MYHPPRLPLLPVFRLLLATLFATLPFTALAQRGEEDIFKKIGGSVTGFNASWTKTFTLEETTDITVYWAAQGVAQIAIASTEDISAFEEGEEIPVFLFINRGTGRSTATLGAGEYFVGIRNGIEDTNKFSFEIDEHPYGIDGHNYQRVLSAESGVLTPGSTNGSLFTSSDRVWLMMDGVNTGCDFYVIPADQVDSFNSGGDFRYHPYYEGSGGASPIQADLNLPPGDYALVVRNESGEPQGYSFAIHLWQGGTDVTPGSEATASTGGGDASVPTINSLGFPLAEGASDPWAEDRKWGWMASVGDGWIYLLNNDRYYWSGGFGSFEKSAGLYLYNLADDAWIWTNDEVFPEAFDFKQNDWTAIF